MSPETATNTGSAAWDVFVSHSHTDEAQAVAIASALAESGMRVFRAQGTLGPFTSISDSVLQALRNSRLLLACYSADYPRRSACQYEFATAYLIGQAEGNPLRRVLAVNLERTTDHIEPRHLRDVLLPSIPALPSIHSVPTAFADVVTAVGDSVAATPGLMGEIRERPTNWVAGQVAHPPNDFVGRWRELWWLHSALHPHVGPLTSRPTSPVVVLHGPVGIGKTALAAQYAKRFGSAFPGGIFWQSMHQPPLTELSAPRECLWILDDAEDDPERTANYLPVDPGVPCLIVTRDPRLANRGNALGLDDLDRAESAQLLAARGLDAGHAAIQRITEVTAGSPELRGHLAELAASSGVDAALATAHQPVSPIIAPLSDRLAPAVQDIGDIGWDVLRVLIAAAPAPIPILRIADILGSVRDTDRLHEIVPVQRVVTQLLAAGVLPAQPDAVELKLATGTRLALRQLDVDPYRADIIRAQTIRTLTRLAARPRSVPGTRTWSDEQARTAHRIKSELLHRITGNPLADGKGSLREALNSLHELLRTTRTVYGNMSPTGLRDAPPDADLAAIVNHLINDVLRDRLTHWHVELAEYEDVRPSGVGRIQHERRWPHNSHLRQELRHIHQEALDIADQLTLITGESRTWRRPAPGESG